jgi:formate C-acetyltransferase
MLSNMKLPFEKFSGGYASHIGVDPKFFNGDDLENKGIQFYQNIIKLAKLKFFSEEELIR